jgi:programmed cell death protein 4
LLQF